MANSGEKWGESGGKWEKLLKVMKVAKSRERGEKWWNVVKSSEK